jgi:FkbM family methyltransferase
LIGSYWAQIDVDFDGQRSRFFMRDCVGRDQVVRSVAAGGWTAYEAPLPAVIAKLCRRWSPVFVDVGANTGYYSLLAASMGAREVWAFEPVPSIRNILMENIQESDLSSPISVRPEALSEDAGHSTLYLPNASHGLIETSASLNPAFRQAHDAVIEVPVSTIDALWPTMGRELGPQEWLLKVDVESLEPQVLKGGLAFINAQRPVIAIEMLPDADTALFEGFLASQRYTRFHLTADGLKSCAKSVSGLSERFRDHMLVPDEKLLRFAETLRAPVEGAVGG